MQCRSRDRYRRAITAKRHLSGTLGCLSRASASIPTTTRRRPKDADVRAFQRNGLRAGRLRRPAAGACDLTVDFAVPTGGIHLRREPSTSRPMFAYFAAKHGASAERVLAQLLEGPGHRGVVLSRFAVEPYRSENHTRSPPRGSLASHLEDSESDRAALSSQLEDSCTCPALTFTCSCVARFRSRHT